MLELFETESSTILATYQSLDDALCDIRAEVRAGGRSITRTWALGERQHDGGSSVSRLAMRSPIKRWRNR